MVLPSIATLIIGTILIAALLAADWYVWGTTYAADFRQPRPVRPLKAVELIDSVLGRMIRFNRTVLPENVIEPEVTQVAQTVNSAAKDHDGGFKKVA